MDDKLAKQLRDMPDVPGVYLFKNKSGKILYIGKALSLKKRARNYLQKNQGIKTQRLLEEARHVEFIIQKSEEDALILENNLIKEEKPKYNIALRDDKTYPLVCISQDKQAIRIYITRKRKENKAYYFGPFTNVKLLRLALKGIRYILPYASCRSLRKSGCVYAHINLCPAPCLFNKGDVNTENDLLMILKAFSGDPSFIVEGLMERVNKASESLNFEQAQEFLNMALAVNTVLGKGKGLAGIGIADVFDLQERLQLKRLPRRIEGVDISNLFGTYAVGSLVCFVDGRPYKAGYRRYKIKSVRGIDDFSMIREVIERRCRRIAKEQAIEPDLFLIDGGRGQVSSAQQILQKYGIQSDLLGLAKEEELIFLPGKKNGIKLPRYSGALKLLQAVRDDAHRFAVKYHHKLKRDGDFL